MVPSGPPTPIGGAESSSRSNSGMLTVPGNQMPSQSSFSSLGTPRTQYNNVNMLGNMGNVSSLLSQSFGNGGPNSGLTGPGSSNRGVIDGGTESDPLSIVGNGLVFNPPSSFVPSNIANSCPSNQVQGQQYSNHSGNQILPDQQLPQQLEPQNFQYSQQLLQQFSNAQTSQQQQQYQTIRGGLGSSVGPVKLEPQVANDQHGHRQQQQQLQSVRNLAPVKLEQHPIQNMRTLAPVKMESQHSDHSLYLQQQQFLHMSRQSSQSAAAAQINLLHQQKLCQLQQQQLLKAMPQQRAQLQQQLQQPNFPLRSPAKPGYEPGMGARRLTHYMYQQQHRPEDNNIDFWRKFVADYFAPNAKKKWCVSMYGSGRQTTGVVPQDVWHCEICNRKPGRGFEATVEVLPRLFKIKYESGTLEELLYVDMPREYTNSSGQVVLDYAKAIQESVFEQLRVVREGQLRIVFSPDLKICSWEFCARRHEELIPRRLLIPQVSQLGAAAHKYQAASQNTSANLSVQELQNSCNMFVTSARQLAKALEVPLVNDLGYTKRYVRCLQISEVVNSMKDLIEYSRDTRTGPMDSLAEYPRRTGAFGFHDLSQQPEQQLQQQPLQQPPQQLQHQQQQQTMTHNSNSEQDSMQGTTQLATSNIMTSVNNPLHTPVVPTSASSIAGLLHQNSMNSRQQITVNNANSPYSGNASQIQSPVSSSTLPQALVNQPSPFQSPTPFSSNHAPQTSHSTLTATGTHMSTANSPANNSVQQPSLSSEGEPHDSQSSVEKIIQETMMSTQVNGLGNMVGAGSSGNDLKNINGIIPVGNNTGLSGGSGCLMESGMASPNSGMGGGSGFGIISGGLGQSAMMNGIRAAVSNSSVAMNGRVGMTSMGRGHSINHQQSELGNQQLGGLGTVNGFNNLQFD